MTDQIPLSEDLADQINAKLSDMQFDGHDRGAVELVAEDSLVHVELVDGDHRFATLGAKDLLSLVTCDQAFNWIRTIVSTARRHQEIGRRQGRAALQCEMSRLLDVE